MRWFDSTRRALVYKLKLNLEEKLGTHNAFNFHKTHVQEYLQNLVQDLPAKHVLHGAELVAAVDFGGEWQARTIWDAVKTAAKTALIISGGDTIVSVTDIHEHLLGLGSLKDDSFRQYWHYFVSPTKPPAPVNLSKLPELARRVTEDYYRSKHNDIFNNGLSYDLPLTDLVAQVKHHTAELDEIAQRLNISESDNRVNEVAA
ncbi:hypothetical protein AW169_09895 [Corynebacterium stationis]|nr:hypothetical protein AW169_09895 [Corynebacterium stationis]